MRPAPRRLAIPWPLLLVAAVLACSSTAATRAPGSAPEPSPAPSFEMASGIVLAGDRETVYIMRPDGGIEAVDPATGEPRWTSEAADRPLAATSGRLLAQVERAPGGGLGLVFLDRGDGRPLTAELEAPLPAGVWAPVEESPEVSFTLDARWRRGDILLSWSFVLRWATGVAPPAGAPPFRHRDQGLLRVDPETGRVTPLEAVDSPPSELPAALERQLAAGELRRVPWRAGPYFASLEMRVTGSGIRRAVLSRWRATDGAPLPVVELPPAGVVSVLPSADHRLVLAVTRLEPADPTAIYRWSLFDVATTAPIAELPSTASATPFCVVGPRLLHLAPPAGRRVVGEWVEEPRRLRAVALADGSELWSRPLRDPAYRGPRPPGTAGGG